MTLSRRNLFTAAGTVGLAVAAPSIARPRNVHRPSEAELQAALERYVGFGVKASGGPGDNAAGAWLESELSAAGYRCTRQSFEAPFFDARQATLSTGDLRAPIIPQGLVVPTGPQGLSAPLRLATDCADLKGAIAVVVLPYKRWVAISDPDVARPLADAFERGAVAAVAITSGPTGEAIALNVTSHTPGFDRPVAILAPKDSGPVLAAAAAARTGVLTIDGRGGRRPAFNNIARLDRKAAKTVVLATPRSGWFTCAGERGPGVVALLFLARYLVRANDPVNIELVATSGHEYEFLGAETYIQHGDAPPPAATRLWVHIGATIAARDWLEHGSALLPLPTADSQRVLTATSNILDRVRPAFAGISGFEVAYPAGKAMSAGELVNVLDAGYPSAIGLYGAHRYFHTLADDMRCVSGDLLQPVVNALQSALVACLDPAHGG